MRFGVCNVPKNTKEAEAAGFDFVEWPLAGALRPEEPEIDILPPLQEVLRQTRLRPETWNLLLPGDLKIVGEAVDGQRVGHYLRSALSRVKALGGEIVVFGSGGARRIPDGFTRERAWEQIANFLQEAGAVATQQDVTIAIEPLNTGECNILNSVAEAVDMARQVALLSVRVLSDLYHVATDGQSYEETRQAADLLAHVHVAGATQRHAPLSQDISFLVPFFRVLKEAEYAGRISVEGEWTDFTREAPECLDTLHQAWDAA